MAATRPVQAPPDGDLSYSRLVRRVVRGDGVAWRDFVERFSRLLFSLLWRYARGDADLCADLFLFVVDGLHQSNEAGERFFRLRRYLDSLNQFEGKGRLTTWLGRVTQNLVSDYFREQEGRKTLPRGIQRLDLVSQSIFKLLYWDCLSEREAFATINSAGGGTLSREKFDRLVDAINRSLKTCNRWSLYSEVLRRTPALSLHPQGDGDSGGAPVQAADPNADSVPFHSLAGREDCERAAALGRKLRGILRELPGESRALLVCRFKHGMTAGEIARLFRRREEKQIYAEIERLKDQMKRGLAEAGFNWEDIEGGLNVLDGLLDEFDSKKGKKPCRS